MNLNNVYHFLSIIFMENQMINNRIIDYPQTKSQLQGLSKIFIHINKKSNNRKEINQSENCSWVRKCYKVDSYLEGDTSSEA